MICLSARILAIILLFLSSQAVQAAKTDVVYLQNGDRITGEVKNLLRGKLEFSTDHMGTIHIEWEDIREIVSDTSQALELSNGQRFYGPLVKAENPDIVAVNTMEGQVGLNTLDVISMYPVEASFWERLDLSVSLGFSWDKGSNVGKYNLGIDAIYRLPKSITRLDLSSEITTQENENDTTRSSFNASHTIAGKSKRFWTYFGNLEHNDALGIDLRTLGGAGYGWVPVRSQRNWFSLAAGLDINNENPVEGDSETNLEAVGMLVYEYYKYSSPERSLKVNFFVFPSLTDMGRWRADLSTDFKFEFYKDLFWKLSLYANYDSDPISLLASSSDYGIVSAIAYKF
jgi:hypothetical protein